MKTAAFSTEQNQVSAYYPNYKHIQSATHYIDSTTGEQKKLTLEYKALWNYSLDRHHFFNVDKNGNGAWFDDQVDIALQCGVSESTVKRFFRDMASAGYIQKIQIRVSGHKSNSYIILKDLVVVAPDKIKHAQQKQQKKEAAFKPKPSATKTQSLQYDQYPDDYDPFTAKAETLPTVAAKAFKAESVEVEEPIFILAAPKPSNPIKQHKWAVSIDDVLGTSLGEAAPVIDDAPRWWDTDYDEMREPF